VGTAIRESDMGVNPTKGEKDNIWAVKANKPSTEARLEQVKQVS
jgi:ribosome recycling factor